MREQEIAEMLEMLTGPMPGDHCLLCGEEPAVIGMFQHGMKGNKTRVVRYCLCGNCFQKDGVAEQVEKVVAAEVLAHEGKGYAGIGTGRN